MRKGIKGLIIAAASAVVIGCLGFGGSLYLKSLSPRKVISNEGVKIYVEGLSFYKGKDKIVGKVYKPQDTTGRKPVVIWCPGLGETAASGDQICRMIAGKGYIAYAFDFRGGSPSSQSTGSIHEMSLSSEKKDIETVVDNLRDKKFVRKDEIYLMGHGQAGLVAALAAPGAKGVNGLILLAPSFNIPDVCEEAFPKNRQIKDTTLFGGNMLLGKEFITDAKGTKPYKGLSKFKGEVLLVHGTSDEAVPYSYSVKAAAEFPKGDLRLIDGMGHSLNGKDGSKAMSLVEEYLESHI